MHSSFWTSSNLPELTKFLILYKQQEHDLPELTKFFILYKQQEHDLPELTKFLILYKQQEHDLPELTKFLILNKQQEHDLPEELTKISKYNDLPLIRPHMGWTKSGRNSKLVFIAGLSYIEIRSFVFCLVNMTGLNIKWF